MRDLSIVEISLHIANCNHQYREDQKIYENDKLSFEARQGAYVRMCKARDLLDHWRGVKRDVMKKAEIKEVI